MKRGLVELVFGLALMVTWILVSVIVEELTKVDLWKQSGSFCIGYCCMKLAEAMVRQAR